MSLRIVIKADGLCEGKGVFFATVDGEDFESWIESARLIEIEGRMYRRIDGPETP